MSTQPHQPTALDPKGTLRFKPNAIVSFLKNFARNHGCTLNDLEIMDFPQEDRRQFAQLTGYSVSGYLDLGFKLPTKPQQELTADQAKARIEELEAELEALRNGMRGPMAQLFRVHPDTLKPESQ